MVISTVPVSGVQGENLGKTLPSPAFQLYDLEPGKSLLAWTDADSANAHPIADALVAKQRPVATVVARCVRLSLPAA